MKGGNYISAGRDPPNDQSGTADAPARHRSVYAVGKNEEVRHAINPSFLFFV